MLDTGRTCGLCKTKTTPLWRRGPPGFETLCNTCCLRWKRHAVLLSAPYAAKPTECPDSPLLPEQPAKVDPPQTVISSPAPPRVQTPEDDLSAHVPSVIAVSQSQPVFPLRKGKAKVKNVSIDFAACCDANPCNCAFPLVAPALPVAAVPIEHVRPEVVASPISSENAILQEQQEKAKKLNAPRKKKQKKRSNVTKKTRNLSARKVVVERNNNAHEDDYEDEDPNKVYCYCRQPYDPELFYIQCDFCDEWFHGVCVNMNEEQAERIFLWFCQMCERNTGRRPVFKKFCAAWLADAEAREFFEPESGEPGASSSPTPDTHDGKTVVDVQSDVTLPSQWTPDEVKQYISPLSPPPESSRLFRTPLACLKYLPDPVAVPAAPAVAARPAPPQPPPPSAFSRYYSRDCGLAVARHAVRISIADGAIGLRGAQRRQCNSSSARELYVRETFDALDTGRLRALVAARRSVRRRVLAARAALWRVECAAWRADVIGFYVRRTGGGFSCGGIGGVDDEKENAQDAPVSARTGAKAKVKKRRGVDGKDGEASKGPRICGFDSRILRVWDAIESVRSDKTCSDTERSDDENDDDDGFDFVRMETAINADQVQQAVPATVCMCTEDICKDHCDWRVLRVQDIKLELRSLMVQLEEICAEERITAGRMRHRRNVMTALARGES